MRHVHRHDAGLQPTLPPHAIPTAYGVQMIPPWNDRTYAYCHYRIYGRYLADLQMAVNRPCGIVAAKSHPKPS